MKKILKPLISQEPILPTLVLAEIHTVFISPSIATVRGLQYLSRICSMVPQYAVTQY
jgi:hypothetical protein